MSALNREAFALFIHTRMQHPALLTLTVAAEQAGVSKAQIFRALHRQPIAIEAFLSLCIWIETNPFAFLLDPATGRGLAPLPAADVSRLSEGETRGAPHFERVA